MTSSRRLLIYSDIHAKVTGLSWYIAASPYFRHLFFFRRAARHVMVRCDKVCMPSAAAAPVLSFNVREGSLNGATALFYTLATARVSDVVFHAGQPNSSLTSADLLLRRPDRQAPNSAMAIVNRRRRLYRRRYRASDEDPALLP